MTRVLLMRLDAPLISFGGVSVDNYGYTEDYPALSMVTGLLANALGYHHRGSERLQRLQNRLRMASRCDRPGERLVDYQTVDLGQELISDALGWTMRGKPERRGGLFSTGTHIRYRHYLADSVHTVALCLEPESESPTLDDLAEALQAPARPLFIGRKCCIPSTPLFLSITDAASPLQALESLQRIGKRGRHLHFAVLGCRRPKDPGFARTGLWRMACRPDRQDRGSEADRSQIARIREGAALPPRPRLRAKAPYHGKTLCDLCRQPGGDRFATIQQAHTAWSRATQGFWVRYAPSEKRGLTLWDFLKDASVWKRRAFLMRTGTGYCR